MLIGRARHFKNKPFSNAKPLEDGFAFWYTERYMLNYNIKGTGVEVSDEIRLYVEKNLAHVEKFLQDDPSAHVDVEIKHLPEGRSGKYCAEFTVAAGGTVYRAEHWGGGLHEAIDLAREELMAELRKAKQKRVHLLRRSAGRVKEYLRGWRANP
jgi:ribosomal subunit interface protein